MSKSSGNFEPGAFAEINSGIEDLKSRLSKNAANRVRTEERMVCLRDEGVAIESELRTKTADLEAMARKGVTLLTKKGNVSADLIGLLLRVSTDDGRSLSLENESQGSRS